MTRSQRILLLVIMSATLYFATYANLANPFRSFAPQVKRK